ncbi:hypothetical protein GJ496_010807 [Pomphorhynchus laevis]|nr:hypothetical protein GJ496_010807 [Pomphorhynchus laevis]
MQKGFTNSKSIKWKISGGSTVVLLLLCDNLAHIAWLGDSVAYGIHNQTISLKTLSHKPNRKDELDRIQRHGGCVTKGTTFRINGISSVSRSLGDILLKPFISHEPEQDTIDIAHLDAILLGTDGFADFCSDKEVVDVLYTGTSHDHIDYACAKLVEKAQNNHSDDNIMVLLICKQWPLPTISSEPIVPVESMNKSSSLCDNDRYEFLSALNRPLSAIVNLRPKTLSSTDHTSLHFNNGMRPYSNLL